MDTESLIRAMERLVRTRINPHTVVCQDVYLPVLRRYVQKVRDHHEAALRGGSDGRMG